VRSLVASDGIYISSFKLDATKQLGKELVVFAIDLPFNFLESKSSIVSRARRLLNKTVVEIPDLVIGDFNMTRNSNAMKQLFPAMIDAWDYGGTGWSSSYHRAFPLFHIDHILVSEDFQSLSYELIDPQFGRHSIQLLELWQ
jgi:endonuclease/exonuclease/phosphatase family metal-dependent hydrolase